ncbi:glycosyltransferase [Vibrio vulnificus]|uniref:glycosyltransferase n=1 Tax=Vibrio vulnificus TaxID=672 RepID=UPI00092747C0|nr:glycosyltransferase [Vibrio vulnificus]EJE8693661.1 glycosyltransferase [Vibrio vulnificus]OJI49978.1 putative glycosyltransferase EpsF [Vibrio vulnificus]POB21976.1 glycosyl hydrolase family 1 [Vibrio vulnificus]HAS8133306.1 glycosyltransferase [Vibrio vulnificus]
MSERIKVLYIVSTLKRCGPNNQLFNIVNNLDLTKFSPLVVTLSKEGSESFWSKFQDAGINIHCLGLHRLFGLFTIKKKLLDVIADFEPKIIHTQGYRADTLVETISSHTTQWRHVCTVRNIPQQDYLMTYGRVVGEYMYKTHMRSLKKVDFVVGVSKAVSDNLKSTFFLENVSCINNGVDVNLYSPSSTEDVSAIKNDLNIPKDKVIFISTGHLSKRKDPEFLIEGFLKANLENSILLLVGDGELKDLLMHKYSQEKSVFFIGRTKKISDYLKSSDYYISCSKSEGLPNSVLEALSSGVPCILSNIEPHCQISKCANEKGVVTYNISSLRSYIDMLKFYYHENKYELSISARDVAINYFSAKNMSLKYQDIYVS